MDERQPFPAPERAQSVVEYAFVIALVSVAVVAVLAGAAPGWLDAVAGEVNDALGIGGGP